MGGEAGRGNLFHMHGVARRRLRMIARSLRIASKFFGARRDGELAAVGALKRIGNKKGEIKSMRAADSFRCKGAGEAILLHLIQTARDEGLTWLGLETGRHEVFEPAQRLYAKHGFAPCDAYADYVLDDFSMCMGMDLEAISLVA